MTRRPPDSLPKFARNELVIGQMVGKGGFSLVFEIVKIDVDEVYDISRSSAIDRRNVADQAVDEEGRPKFAVKMLRDDLMEDEHSKGVIDLAVEARFLRRLAHPHIVAMRATANSDPLESRFFVILEMLDGTLEGKITQWRREINKGISIWCGPLGYCCANKKVLSHSWLERFDVARSIASALKYLHEEEIIYRDLKPENVGFSNGVVKLFDFGLSKRLLPDDRVANGLYRLTGNTGSLRYMAPEVALNQCYNTKADSYSFAIVLWQICSLTVPYAGYNVRRHADEVVAKGVRPKIARSWPVSWGEIMITCWQTDIDERLSFDHILDFLNDEYDILKKESHGEYVGQHVKDIRGKKKRKPDDFDINKTLDTDTRIIHEDDDGLQELELAERHHDVDLI